MPELPEVETVCRALSKVIPGKIIVFAEVRIKKLRRFISPSLANDLSGLKIISVSRVAKFILIKMSADKTLVVHLGMTGFCSFFDSAISPGKHDHIVLHFSDGSVFLYNDMRRFGEVFLAHGPSDVEERVFSFAKDPFHESWSYATFFDALKKKKSPIKTVLLNQKIISGLGNIYVCEALFHSNVSPVAIAASLSEERSRMLLDAVRFVLNKAISLGGSSIVDYQHPDGGEGTFQQHLFVYSRTGKNCLRTACEGLVKRIKQAGRSSFFCSECQL